MKSQNHPEIKIDAENKNRPKNEIRAGKQNSIFDEFRSKSIKFDQK